MKPRYCYWSVCDGADAAMMEHCVRTARQAGVFKEFHVLTDRPVEGCESYDAYQIDKAHGLFKLHYLKVGMSRLNFDYFVWIDADTMFVRNPVDLLGALGRSPMHVPLECGMQSEEGGVESEGELRTDNASIPQSELRIPHPKSQVCELMKQEGITNQVYLSGSAFWIVHHDAIETVYDLALGFWHKAKESELIVDVSAALSFAMQILCADPEAHLLSRRPDLWTSHAATDLSDGTVRRNSWSHWHEPETVAACAAIVHSPRFSDPMNADDRKAP